MAQTQIVATIKPIHALVAGVMETVGTPDLLLDGSQSPHTFSLKPSQARMLQTAQVIFWVGPELETALAGSLVTLAPKAIKFSLIDADGLQRLDLEGSGHNHEEGKAEDHDHSEALGRIDPHIWLNPDNAKLLVSVIRDTLAKVNPEHAQVYRANAVKMLQRLDALTLSLEKTILPLRGKNYLVFHDAYRYFEDRFDIRSLDAISANLELSPGAGKIRALRDKIQLHGVSCLFTEPQFDQKMVSVVVEGSDIKLGVLDPLGQGLEAGADLYFDLMNDMARSMADCLLRGK